MTAKKRGFIEIVGNILKILNENSLKKSHISHRGNLDSRSVSKYLDMLVQLRLVKKLEDLQQYSLTKRGIKFLDQYNKLAELLENNFEAERE